MSMTSHSARARAVIFDLDGTLTLPNLDFEVIRREIGLPSSPAVPVLEAMMGMSSADRAVAESILHRHEELAAADCELQEGARDVLAAIRKAGMPVALLTRNSRRSVETVTSRHGLEVDWVHTREDGPVKPAPDAVLDICRRFGVMPGDSWVVGDFLFDVQAGASAGATTVLMVGSGPVPEWADRADYVIRRLDQLLPLLGVGR